MNRADAAVAAILQDLRDRRGLRQAWDAIDPDVMEEILSEWALLIERAMEDDS